MADNEKDLPLGPEVASSQVEAESRGEVVETRQEETRTDIKDLLRQKALEMEILGWFKAGDIHWVTSLIHEERKWSDEFKRQVTEEAEKLFTPETYGEFLLVHEGLGNDPWPRIQARCKEHFERGEWKEGIEIYGYRLPFNSKIWKQEERRRVVPDEQLLACGRVLRAQGNHAYAMEAYARLATPPPAAEASEIVIWLLEGDHLADAADLAVDWNVTAHNDKFEEAAQGSLAEDDLMGAYKGFKAARHDLEIDQTLRRQLLDLAKLELQVEKAQIVGFRSDEKQDRNERLARLLSGKKHIFCHPFQAASIIGDKDGTDTERARVRRSVIQKLGEPDDKMTLVMHEQDLGFAPPEYILEILEGVPMEHPGVRQRILDSIEVEIRNAELELSGRGRTGAGIGIFEKREKCIQRAAKTLQKARELCDREGVNPPVFIVAKLARLYSRVGNQAAVLELVAKHGEPLHLELASDPTGKGKKEAAESLDPKTALSKLKQRIRSNKLRAVVKECSEYAQVAGLDNIRESLQKRAAKELAALVEQMRTARGKKQEGGEEEKSSWGKESSVNRWNERSQEIMRVYELLGDTTIEEQTLLSELAVLLQQAYGDGGKAYGYTAWVDARGPKESVQVARKIYERLARKELGLPLTESQSNEGEVESDEDDEN